MAIREDVKKAARERCIELIDTLLATGKMPMIIIFDDRKKNTPGWTYVVNAV
jgi:hypothetical protein